MKRWLNRDWNPSFRHSDARGNEIKFVHEVGLPAVRYFNQWQVDDIIVHEIRRTVTEIDNLLFSAMTQSLQPRHIGAEAARASEFGQLLGSTTFKFSVMVGLSVGDTTLGTLWLIPDTTS